MHHKKFFIGLLTIAALSCKENSVAPVDPVRPLGGDGLIPMKTGYQWIYRRTTYDTTGASLGFVYDTSRVYRDTIIQGEHWFDFQNGGTWTNRTDGAWLWNGVNAVKWFTLTLGDSVYWPASDQPWGGTYVKLVSLNSSVTVPSGPYSAYEYHYIDQNLGITAEKYYIVPKLGIVKRDIRSWTNGRHQATLDLFSASIN